MSDEMGRYRSSDYLAKQDGHRIADHSSDRLELDPLARNDESIVTRERLEYRPFAQRQGSVLFRMTEPAVAEAEETAS